MVPCNLSILWTEAIEADDQIHAEAIAREKLAAGEYTDQILKMASDPEHRREWFYCGQIREWQWHDDPILSSEEVEP